MIMKKTCPQCNEEKTLCMFYKDRHTISGRTVYCKECVKQKSSKQYKKPERKSYMRDYDREKYKNDENFRNKHRNARYKYMYGISLEDYDRMHKEQNGVCAICKKPSSSGKRLAVDHDSVLELQGIKKVRGLLCHICNLGIGNLQHSEEIIQSALDYLKSSR